MPQQQAAWPGFDSSFLGDIASAVQRRGKAIRYQTRLSCEREWEERTDGTWERMNLDLVSHVQVRLSVWSDGIMWLRVCQAGPRRSGGWKFLDRLAGDVRLLPPSEVAERLEATLALCSSPHPANFSQRLRGLWKAVDKIG
jgi:hypothetical protein